MDHLITKVTTTDMHSDLDHYHIEQPNLQRTRHSMIGHSYQMRHLLRWCALAVAELNQHLSCTAEVPRHFIHVGPSWAPKGSFWRSLAILQEFMDLANGDPKAAVEKIRHMQFPILQEIAKPALANGLSLALPALISNRMPSMASPRPRQRSTSP